MNSLRRLAFLAIFPILAACGGGGGGSSDTSASGGAASGGSTSGGSTSTSAGGATIPVTGKVVDGATNTPIAGATISWVARPQRASGSTGTTTTGSDGSFQFQANPDDASNARVAVAARAVGYVAVTLSDAPITPSNGQLEQIVLVRESAVRGSISGVVRNARTGAGIAGMVVRLADGQQSDPLAASSMLTTSDAQGNYAFSNLVAGTYTVAALPEDFEWTRRTAIPVQSNAVTAQDLVLSPRITLSEIRIVLTWGASPSDLDAHLTGPNADASRFHVYYSNKLSAGSAPFAGLDLDDTSSFGPETITLTKLQSGVYRFSVHDFTNRNSAASTALAGSGAKVEVYTYGQAVPQVFYVPNQPGNVWTVFELVGPYLTAPTITPVNSIGFQADESAILTDGRREAAVHAGDVAQIGAAAAASPKP